IRVQPVPPALRAGKPTAAFDAARAAVAGERKGNARDAHLASLDNHIGQEYLIDVPAPQPTVVRVRSVVIGSGLYELSVTGSAADVAGETADAFLDSFTFQE